MSEAVPLTNALLATMRLAAKKTIELREPFITPRAILLALLDDAEIGPAIRSVVSEERVRGAHVEGHYGVARLPEETADGEQPAMARYDTLAFKTPDGRTSVWLSRDAYSIFAEGAQRAENGYTQKELALGLAAQAVFAPGVLSAIRVEPGIFSEAIYKL